MQGNSLWRMSLSLVTCLIFNNIQPQAADGSATVGADSDDRRPVIVIPPINRRGQAGADLSEESWMRSARLTGFLQTEGQRLATQATWVGLTYDDKALWMEFRCAGQRAQSLKADIKENDGPVWRDDSVEFVIHPSGMAGKPFHFVVNAIGVKYDAQGLDKSWNANWTARVTTEEEGWSVTVVIPFAELPGVKPPHPGHVWAVNFGRNACLGNSKERSSWSATTGSFQDVKYCGFVEFGKAGTPLIQLSRIDPVVIGKNTLQVQAPSVVQYHLTGTDKRDKRTLLSQGPVPADHVLSFRLEDDRIRHVWIAMFDSDGHLLARARYPIASPAVSAEVGQLQEQYDQIRTSISKFSNQAQGPAKSILDEARVPLEDAVATVSSRERQTAENWTRLAETVAQLRIKMNPPASYAATLARFPKADFAVGLANPTQKVMIRDHAFEGRVDDHYDLALAKNEHEGFQVVLMPFHTDLRGANVSVSPLVSTDEGERWRGETTVSLVGHVDVEDNTRYEVEHHGWWPDPLLSFQKSCDIRAGEHVAFWIDVATRTDTIAGEYKGKVIVVADGCEPINIDLNVKVWDFKLPQGTHLRNAFTYDENTVRKFYADRWDREMRYKYYDFILDHRLNIDHLYRRDPPDLSVLEYARRKGLNAFNLGAAFRKTDSRDDEKELKKYMANLKKKGLFPYAYVYGFDEVKSDKFPEIRKVFGQVHERFPGLETMTTAIDHSYGRETGLREVVDIWVPLTDWYDPDEADRLRAEGKAVWWYVCVTPEHPYANWFIEYPAIEARLLTGAMSYKYRVDGFLYYMTSLWTGNKQPIRSGPFTDWNPGSFVNKKDGYTANGDGSLICPGPDGPLSTIRLENIRDGLEDYEYLYLLAEQAARVRKLPANQSREDYLERVEKLLAVPASVVRDLTEYTRDPEVLCGFRSELADTILEGQTLRQRR